MPTLPTTPLALLEHVLADFLPHPTLLRDYQAQWQRGEPQPYTAGVVWRAFMEETLVSNFALGYITAFYNPAAFREHLETLLVATVVDKYSDKATERRYMPYLMQQSEDAHRGKRYTRYGSGLRRAENDGDQWRLVGPPLTEPADTNIVLAVSGATEAPALFVIGRDETEPTHLADAPETEFINHECELLLGLGVCLERIAGWQREGSLEGTTLADTLRLAWELVWWACDQWRTVYTCLPGSFYLYETLTDFAHAVTGSRSPVNAIGQQPLRPAERRLLEHFATHLVPPQQRLLTTQYEPGPFHTLQLYDVVQFALKVKYGAA